MDIQKIRKDTPGVQYVTHFNSAGSALPTQSTLDAIISYLREEARYGGYSWYEKNQENLAEVYREAARLINAGAEEIALTENASVAFVKALFGINWNRGDVILTSEIEYGNNFLNYLKLKEEKGVDIRIAPNDGSGDIDLQALEHLIDDRVRLIAITHIPTNSGVVAPVEAIGRMARAYDILYLVDACQSIGHLPFDVEKVGCDFASATSRKYLRGPRGLGFLYVKKERIEELHPSYFDMIATEWIDQDRYILTKSSKMFENWEKPMAMVAGFVQALAYANAIDMEQGWARIQELADYLRRGLAQRSDIRLLDIGKKQCGIVSFLRRETPPGDLKKYLSELHINTSVSPRFCTALDMNKRGLGDVNRASLHYYNTFEEIDLLLQSLDGY